MTSETLEHVEDFTADADGYGDETLTHDAAGNLTYDGQFSYTYDAWNRLVKVTKAYRDPSTGDVTPTLVINTLQYDGLGRRIRKAVTYSADLDGTYHYYYASTSGGPGGQSIIETRNGSNQTLKQHVWGLTYIDEIVQTSLNDDPADTEQDCESHFWALQDANFNVLGVVDSGGVLRERYEYTPYGERKVFTSPGVNDPLCYAPIDISKRWTVSSVAQPYGLCEVGHQGLWHDEETGLVENKGRMLHPQLGQFMQPDPLGYIDGMNLREYLGSNPLRRLDPTGYSWTEQECLDFFQSAGATGPTSGWFKGFFNGLIPFGDPFKLYPNYFSAVAGKYTDAGQALAAAQQILQNTVPGSQAHTDAKQLVDETTQLLKDTGSHYRFFRFMIKHGCKCCAVRDHAEGPATKYNWHKESDKVSKAKTAITFLLGQVLKQAGKTGNPLTKMDITGALGAYSSLKNYAAQTGVDAVLNNAIIQGAAGQDPACPSFKDTPPPKTWYEAVDDHGEPAK